MFKINRHSISDICQRPVDGIEQCVLTDIVLWSDPFSFHYPPPCFGNVQMRRIWRKIEKVKTTMFPDTTQFLYFPAPVDTGIIKNNTCIFFNLKPERIKKFNDLVRINAFSCTKSVILIITVNHSEDIDPVCFQGRNINIFVTELPPVRNVSFGADMAFIGKIKIDFALSFQLFKFLQLPGLVLIELRRGNSPWAFSYSLISCANADKKRLNVHSLASFPVAFCQASLALLTLCLSCSITLRTISSSEQSMTGFRPRPGRVSKPSIPERSKRFTHELTDICDRSVCKPISWLERPFDFKSTARQRIRKQWVSPLRKISSNAKRCESVNVSILILPIIMMTM